MARNDGIDRTSVRNVNLTKVQINNTQRHNEREKDSYEELKEQTKDFLTAIKKAPERVRAFISKILHNEQIDKPKVQRRRENIGER